MVIVSWSDQAKADLESIYPAARNMLMRYAGEVLHLISPRNADPAEEGVHGEIMWHRGDGHGRFMKRDRRGPQDYFLFYRKCHSAPGCEDLEFEVLAVISIHEVGGRWLAQMTSDPPDAADARLLRAAHHVATSGSAEAGRPVQ